MLGRGSVASPGHCNPRRISRLVAVVAASLTMRPLPLGGRAAGAHCAASGCGPRQCALVVCLAQLSGMESRVGGAHGLPGGLVAAAATMESSTAAVFSGALGARACWPSAPGPGQPGLSAACATRRRRTRPAKPGTFGGHSLSLRRGAARLATLIAGDLASESTHSTNTMPCAP